MAAVVANAGLATARDLHALADRMDVQGNEIACLKQELDQCSSAVDKIGHNMDKYKRDMCELRSELDQIRKGFCRFRHPYLHRLYVVTRRQFCPHIPGGILSQPDPCSRMGPLREPSREAHHEDGGRDPRCTDFGVVTGSGAGDGQT